MARRRWGAALLLSLGACREPTQVRVVLTTDVPCGDLRDTAIFVAPAGAPEEGSSPGALTDACAGSSIGDIVLVPASDDAFDLRVVASVGVGVDLCTPEEGYAPSGPNVGCIVARRSLAFVDHASLDLPVELQAACIGQSCGVGRTCVDGVCTTAAVTCDEGGCTEPRPPDVAPAQPPQLGRIAVGADHSCLLRADGTVACWGGNGFGQFGTGAVSNVLPPTPAMTGLPGPVDHLAASFLYTCVVVGATIRCAGDNQAGELGAGLQATSSPTPVEVSGLSSVTRLATGATHACALDAAGAHCWGSNPYGQLGAGLPLNVLSPAPLSVPDLGPIVEIDAGNQATCGVLADGRVVCVGCGGANGRPSACGLAAGQPFAIPGKKAVQVSAGLEHACARTDDGGVYCWGSNSSGALGESDLTLDRSAPGAAPVVTRAVFLVARDRTTCALLDDATVRCWGANDLGQVGDGGTQDATSPKEIAAVAGAIDVALSDTHGCALVVGGDGAQHVQCWGDDSVGQVTGSAGGGVLAPTSVPGL